MFNLVNCTFNRTYNPSGQKNALSDIKRLLTSRDALSQSKACGYLLQMVSRYPKNSKEEWQMIEYLLDNDIPVFLCEATSNLDFGLFKSIISCVRSLWRSSRFFSEEHAAHATSAVLRALAYYGASGPPAAVEVCLHFLCDLLNGINTNKTTSPLCHQSAYSAVQLLSCLNSLIPQINAKPNVILSSALVLQTLICYQPEDLYIRGCTAKTLAESLEKWLEVLLGALKHSMLVENNCSGMIYVVMCHLGMDAMRLTKLLNRDQQKIDFVNSILADSQDLNVVKQSSAEITRSVIKVMSELVELTQEHQSQIPTEEYGVFLKFMLNFFHEINCTDVLQDFCDFLFSNGYLTMLPQLQIKRNDSTISKLSTLIIGEMLKILSDKYLRVNDSSIACTKHIHMGLVELQYGIEKPQHIGMQFKKRQPYSLLIYIYFYCQSSENPEETMSPLLPFLVEHILMMPKTFVPPPHIVKALWLVFAMSTISNNSIESLEQRVYLDKATDRLVKILGTEPEVYYTHHPAVLLWAFTSVRISSSFRIHVLSQWLKLEPNLPTELTVDPSVWELLLTIIVHSADKTVVANCMDCLRVCVSDGKEATKHEFTRLVWDMLPSVLSKALVGEELLETNISYLLDLATTLLPTELDPTVCVKTAVLMAVLYTKNMMGIRENKEKQHFEYVCLKICMYLMQIACNQNDNRVLITYVNRVGFLPSVLSSVDSRDDTVACAALELLTHVVHYFTKNNYQPKTILQIESTAIVRSLRQDNNCPRSTSLLQLVYVMLNSGFSSPLGLDHGVPVERQCNGLRTLMIRIQLMLCCRDTDNQSSAGWKTLSGIFKYAICFKNDQKLVNILTSQPLTLALIQFQMTQNISTDFLTFLQSWLNLLKTTIKKEQEDCRRRLNKNSFVVKTLVILKKCLARNEYELAQNSSTLVKEILDDCNVKY